MSNGTKTTTGGAPAAAMKLNPPTRMDRLTVEALVDAHRPGGEGMQALVSQWTLPETFGDCDAFDAAGTDGLDSTGYFGAVFDGRYVYFVPEMHADLSTHAVVLRYDTHGDFGDRASYAAFDAARVTGTETRGFYGGACDGRYVYFVPRQFDLTSYHSRVLRLDTHQPFKDSAAWSVCDAGLANSQQGAAFDGRYLYCCPGYEGDPRHEDQLSGRVIRLDTQAPFEPGRCTASVDLAAMLGPRATGFDGGAFDGRYVYFVPLEHQVVVRHDTRGDFADPAAWEAFDASALGLGVCVGALFDGRFLYFCAYSHGTMVRYDTTLPFGDAAAWTRFAAQHQWPNTPLGFDGGFFDGRYVHFVPFIAGTGKHDRTFHGNLLRYDTRVPFEAPEAWAVKDVAATGGLRTVGYNAGAFDGRYFYAAPWQAGPNPATGRLDVHARVLRYDTLGEHGSFSLRYGDLGHNGGLCAAVPGPSCVINTTRGPRSVAAHRVLEPGVHHLLGVYDGDALHLYIDGELAAQRQTSGDPLVRCAEAVSVGELAGGDARFDGRVLHAQVDDAPCDAQAAAARYQSALAAHAPQHHGRKATE